MERSPEVKEPFGERRRVSDGTINYPRAEKALLEFLTAMGLETTDEEFKGTPRRVVDMYGELWAGLYAAPPRMTMFKEGAGVNSSEELVVLADIPFVSTCSHHLLPFNGKAHVGYRPDGQVVGISKLARVLDYFAARPQTQERLCQQAVSFLYEAMKPKGVIVLAESEHGCITCRGARKPGCSMVTSASRGDLCKEPHRADFFNHLNRFKGK